MFSPDPLPIVCEMKLYPEHKGLCGEIPLPNSSSVCHAGFVAQEVNAVSLVGVVMQELGEVAGLSAFISQSALRALYGLPTDFKWLNTVDVPELSTLPNTKDDRKIMTSRADGMAQPRTKQLIRQRNLGKHIISSRA